MNIVLFSDTYPPEINGVATSLYNLHMTLKMHGEKCLVVTTNPFNDQVTFEDDIIRVPGIELKQLYGYQLAGPYNQKAFEIVRAFKPDVIHVNHDGGIGQFGFLCASRLNVPTVYTYHTMYEDYTYYVTKGHFDRAAKSIVRSYIKLKSNQSAEFIAPSAKIKDYLRSIGVDGYVNTVPTGIDFSRFMNQAGTEEDAIKLRAELGIGKDDFVLLSLGRIAKEKSIDVCLRGYAKYLRHGETRPSKFLIVGGGPAMDELKELCKELGIQDRVIFAGPVKPDVTQYYYRLGDCFVSASVTETQGLTFMEAMASSLIVLARYDDNLAGTITDGKTGFFFYDEDDFKDRLAAIVGLNSAQRKAVLVGAKKALEPYSLEAFYKNVMEVYRRAIRKNW